MSSAAGMDPQFEMWWSARGEWVEAPNLRRGGESGVQCLCDPSGHIVYIKRQAGHIHRSLRHPLGRPTALREAEALLALATLRIPVPGLAYSGARKDRAGWHALLVTRALDGYLNLDAWYAAAPTAAARRNMLRELAGLLARMHRARWQHGCLYAKHIFVRKTFDPAGANVALLDLEKARRRICASLASRRDMAQLGRHRGLMPDADWRELRELYALAPGRGH